MAASFIVVTAAPPPICSGLPVPHGPAILSPWGANHARPSRADRSGQPPSGPRKRARMPTCSPSRLGTSACSAFRDRRSHRRRWATRSTPGLATRSEMPWLQHAPDRRARYRAATEGNADPRTGAIHAVQGLLRSARLSLQAQPSGGAATHEDFGERSAVNVVAG